MAMAVGDGDDDGYGDDRNHSFKPQNHITSKPKNLTTS
jgi:hypothetical protein